MPDRSWRASFSRCASCQARIWSRANSSAARRSGIDALERRVPLRPVDDREVVEPAAVELAPRSSRSAPSPPLPDRVDDLARRRPRLVVVLVGRRASERRADRRREPRTSMRVSSDRGHRHPGANGPSYRRAGSTPGRFGTPLGVDATRDLAVLSSLGAQIDDLAQRVTEMAERYGETPDSAIVGRAVQRRARALGRASLARPGRRVPRRGTRRSLMPLRARPVRGSRRRWSAWPNRAKTCRRRNVPRTPRS